MSGGVVILQAPLDFSHQHSTRSHCTLGLSDVPVSVSACLPPSFLPPLRQAGHHEFRSKSWGMRHMTGKGLDVYRPFPHPCLLILPVWDPLHTILFPMHPGQSLVTPQTSLPELGEGLRNMSVNKRTSVQSQCICWAQKKINNFAWDREKELWEKKVRASAPSWDRSPGQLPSWTRSSLGPRDNVLCQGSKISLGTNSFGAQNRSLAFRSVLPSSAFPNFLSNLEDLGVAPAVCSQITAPQLHRHVLVGRPGPARPLLFLG